MELALNFRLVPSYIRTHASVNDVKTYKQRTQSGLSTVCCWLWLFLRSSYTHVDKIIHVQNVFAALQRIGCAYTPGVAFTAFATSMRHITQTKALYRPYLILRQLTV